MLDKYQTILKEIKIAGKKALSSQSSLTISKKSDGVDVVTQLDSEIEIYLHNVISNLFPEDGFWGEENEELRSDSEYTWYVDPIDGTKFYAADIPLWSVSIARVKKGDKIPVFSAIYIPQQDHLFHAVNGEGAFKNNQKLSVKTNTDLSKLTLAFDFVPTRDSNLNSSIYSKLSVLLQSFYRVRLFGCGSLSTVWTATGFFGCFIKYLEGTKQYNDIVAGLLISQEAGLHVDYQKLDNQLDRIVICQKEILEKVLEIVQ